MGTDSSGHLIVNTDANGDGTIDNTNTILRNTNGTETSTTQILDGAGNVISTVSNTVDPSSSSIDNSRLSVIRVVDLGNQPVGQTTIINDPTGTVAGGLVISGADVAVVDPGINNDGVFNNSPGSIVSGNYRPGNQEMSSAANTQYDLIGGGTGQPLFVQLEGGLVQVNAPAADYANGGIGSYVNIDPLVLDLNGDGIHLSNWVDNNIYFQTNVSPTTGLSDGMAHHTSWVNADDGILVFRPDATKPIKDITQTFSEFFNGHSYANGFAALQSLVKTDPATGHPYTVFNADTAAIDPTTGNSYWSEVLVWRDANQDGVAQNSEMVSLASLGITSISLAGSANTGEQIEGSYVTSRATYTLSDGSTRQAASVELQTNTVGDVTTTAQGGVVITSVSEGGASPSNSFVVDPNATAGHTYTVSNGVLTDGTLGSQVATGIKAIFSSTQNDTITVSASDTGNYWLGGGTGADVLTGGGGNTLFLVNNKTVVHGGAGFNIAQVIDSLPSNINLATSHLQEVIGGDGGGIFDASGTTWNVFIQTGGGNNVVIGGAAHNALSGGTGNDIFYAGNGGSVIHAGAGTDVIYGGSGKGHDGTANSDVIYAGAGQDTVILGTNNSIVYAGTGSLKVTGNAGGFSVIGLHGSYADYNLTHNADGSTTITDKVAGRDGAVTFTNVASLDFSDISQIDIATAQGMPVSDTVHVSGNGPYTIQASALLANDVDYAGRTLSIRELLDKNGHSIARGGVGEVNGGIASLSQDGLTITFTPTPGYAGVPGFRYHVQDDHGQFGQGVQQVGTTNTAEMVGTVYLSTPGQPLDPLFVKEWYLTSADIAPVWKDYTGAGVKIGIFDPSGNVDFSNPDLAAHPGSVTKLDGAPGIEKLGNHATLVAGVIGAARDGQGAVGVAYGATLGSEAVDINNTTLLDWSKYDIVNNSWTISPPYVDNFLYSPGYASLFSNAAYLGRNGLGTAIVFAGGNDRALGRNTNDLNTTNSRYVITVGGINATTDLASLTLAGTPFSNKGASILVSAPASNVASTGIQYTNEFGQTFGADIQATQGTSFATPIVSGIIALMLQANPNLGARDIQNILALSARRVDPNGSNWTTNGATDWNGGGMHTSDDYGLGEVDARAAVRLAETWAQQTGQAPATFNNEATVSLGGVATGYTASGGGYLLTTDQGASTPYIDFDAASAVHGLSLSTQHIDVRVQLSQVRLGNITIKLVSSSGESSVLFDGPGSQASLSNPQALQDFDFTFDTTKDWGEEGISDWHLVVSYAPGTTPTGKLIGATIGLHGSGQTTGSITVTGNAGVSGVLTPADGQTFFYTDEFGTEANSATGAARSTLNDSSGKTTIDAAAISTNSVIDLNAGSSDSLLAGHNLTIGDTTTVVKAFGGDGDDTFVANTSNDTFYGGRGNDTYQFNNGFGQDTVVNGGAFNAGPSGKLLFGAGINADKLWFTQSGNDLVVQVLGTTSKVTVKNWFASPSNQLASINLMAGVQISGVAAAALAVAGTAYMGANPSFDPANATMMPSSSALAAAFSAAYGERLPGAPITVSDPEEGGQSVEFLDPVTGDIEFQYDYSWDGQLVKTTVNDTAGTQTWLSYSTTYHPLVTIQNKVMRNGQFESTLISPISGRATERDVYDAYGNLLEVDSYDEGGQTFRKVDTYNAAGNIAKTVFTDASTGLVTETDIYAYNGPYPASITKFNGAGQKYEVDVWSQGLVTEIDLFNSAGKIQEVDYFSAINGDPTEKDTTIYNPLGQKIEVDKRNPAGALIEVDVFDGASGSLSTQQINNADGTKTVTIWDLANTQTWSSETQLLSSANQLEKLTTNSRDGTHNITYYDYQNNQTWSSYGEDYTSSMALKDRVYNNDDGSQTETFFDYTNTQSWSSHTDHFTAPGGALKDQTIINDDGSTTVYTRDWQNNQSWSSHTEDYTSGGILKDQAFINDDGTQTVTFKDYNNTQPWSSHTDHYTAGGALKDQTITNDDASTTVYTTDWQNNQTWSSHLEFYAANAAIKEQDINNDNGSIDVTIWDYQNNQQYSTVNQHYVSSGVLQSQVAHWDDGTSQAITFDYNNAQPWAQDVYNYNSGGGQTAHFWVLDNGATIQRP